MRRIVTDADIREGLAALTAACPHLARVHEETGALPPLRKRPKGFEGLARVIVGQQLSIASADAIWGRLSAALQPFAPAVLLAMPDDALKAAGLSRVKVETLRRLAVAVDSGALDISALARAKDEVIHSQADVDQGHRPLDRRHLHHVLARPCRCLVARRPRPAIRREGRASPRCAPWTYRDDRAGRDVAPVASRCSAAAVVLLQPPPQDRFTIEQLARPTSPLLATTNPAMPYRET